jgi:hypothetical protein
MSRWLDWTEIYREGGWWLSEQKSWGWGYTVMHECQDGNCRPTRPEYKYFNHPCAWCFEVVPEGIQALYVLLTGDMDV